MTNKTDRTKKIFNKFVQKKFPDATNFDYDSLLIKWINVKSKLSHQTIQQIRKEQIVCKYEELENVSDEMKNKWFIKTFGDFFINASCDPQNVTYENYKIPVEQVNAIRNILKIKKQTSKKLLCEIKIKLDEKSNDPDKTLDEIFDMLIQQYPTIEKTKSYKLSKDFFVCFGNLQNVMFDWISNYDSFNECPRYSLNSIGHADECHSCNSSWRTHLNEKSKHRINISSFININESNRLENLSKLLSQIGLQIEIYTQQYWRRGTDIATFPYSMFDTSIKYDYIQIFIVNYFFNDSYVNEPQNC